MTQRDWQKDMRPSVIWFAEQMEQRLKENDHKTGWEDCDREFLLNRLEANFHSLCAKQQAYGAAFDAEGTIKKAANIANFAMMLADQARYTIYPDTPAPITMEDNESETISRKPFFAGYKPQFIGPRKETSAEKSLRLDVERMVKEHEDALRNPKGAPAPKEEDNQ